MGEIGCLRGWDLVSSSPPGEYVVTDADLGGQWAEFAAMCQYPLATNQKEVEDTHYHYYQLTTSGNDYTTLQAQAIQTLFYEGDCWKYLPQDPQWWWIPVIDYDDHGITIDLQNAGSGTWTAGSWDTIHHNDPANYLSNNSGEAGPPAPSSSSQDGEIRVAAELPLGIPSGASIRVGFNWEVTGSASVDNGCVQQWKEGILYTAFSNLSEDDHSEDFDLDPLAGE